MSDAASVTKGCRSGVQKLIKREIPQLYDVPCICHLADLAVKGGMQQLPVDIDQLFAFTTVVSDIKNLQIIGALFFFRTKGNSETLHYTLA